MEFCARFVIPKTYDWMSVFDDKMVAVTAICTQSSPAWVLLVSDLPGPWIAQRAVSVPIVVYG